MRSIDMVLHLDPMIMIVGRSLDTKKLLGSAKPFLTHKNWSNFSNVIVQWSREWMWFIIHGLAVGGALNWIQTAFNYFLSEASRFWTFDVDNAHQTFKPINFALPGTHSLSVALNLWICLNQWLCRFGFWVAAKIIFCNSSKRGEWWFCVDFAWGLARAARCAPRQPFTNTWAAFHCGRQDYSNIWNQHQPFSWYPRGERWLIHLVGPFIRI